MAKRQLLTNAYVATVILAGIIVLINAGFPATGQEWIGLIAFGALSLMSEALAITVAMSSLTVSVAFIPVFSSILMFSPPVGVWVAALGSLNWDDLRGGKPWYRNLFNFCQLGMSAALAAYVYSVLGGQAGQVTKQSFLPILASFTAYYLTNAAIPTLVIALISGTSPFAVYSRLIAWSTPGFIAMAPMAVLVAVVFEPLGYVGVVLFILPLFFARMAFKLYRDMRQNYVETIQSLAQAIDAKDHYTMGHSERVAYYAVEIARKLGWRQSRLEQLFFTALLHDIGKIGISEAVLNKPGRLTSDERFAINSHAELGAEIVSKVSFLRQEADFIRHHHEYYSGSGYPAGLAGAAIPLGARIIAVADSFDAMTSLRVYHSPRSAYEAVEELKRCSGTQFDPLVVKAFLQVITEKSDILDSAQEAAAAGFASLAGLNGQ
ncbi:MAG: HD-GYP domain-containing protein [Peptococcaceae bacterium]|nr:HD-GYP domain-containing protein [Peptococcaceae bacterium]